MDKEHILCEIRRTAAENDGKPLGLSRFGKETGIRDGHWLGKYWARWGDALVEAGFSPNTMQVPYEDDTLLEKLVVFIRELERVPVRDELKLRRQSDTSFPSYPVFKRFGAGKHGLAAALLKHCEGKADLADVAAICRRVGPRKAPSTLGADSQESDANNGYIYLLKSGKFYKIGRTNAVGRREYELGIQLPDKAERVHVIATDDPVGIEAYWHNRFAEKRRNGEWFELSAADIKAFKRRKFM